MSRVLQPRAERFRFLPREQAVRTSLPWIIGLMVLLATLGVAAGIALGSSVGALDTAFRDKMTVQVVSADPGALDARRDAALALLADHPAVAEHRLLPDAELTDMLTPWLGGGELGETIRIPAMIDVTLASGGDADALTAALTSAVPDIVIDRQSDWLAPVARLAWVLTAIAILAALLLAGATAAVIAIGTRAGLGRHADSIAVLHLIGAEDRTIAELFQYRLAMTAFLGAIGGFALALLVIVILSLLVGAAGQGLLSAAAFPLWGWFALLSVPVAAVLLALFTSRFTVERSLAQRV